MINCGLLMEIPCINIVDGVNKLENYFCCTLHQLSAHAENAAVVQLDLQIKHINLQGI